jgi:FAD/FMN-containing dehydrogenase
MAMNVDQLKEQVHGEVIVPGDQTYDEARAVHNGMIDKRPSAIVTVANTGDVMSTIQYARENGLDLAIRGGGHSGPGFGTVDDGVVIDFSQMRSVRVDPVARTARADAGVTWGDINAATHAFGLATPGGIISTTGVAGLTLGGGVGYLTRGFGLSIDNLISVDVVTADGQFLVASEDENADLFWALRGGGGNFGVCTSFEYRLHPLKDVYWGPMFYEVEEAQKIFEFYREYIKTAPEQMGVFPAFQIAPPLPFIPEDRHGDMFVVLIACWTGPVEEGEAAFRPFHEVAEVKAEMVGAVPFPAINAAFDGLYPKGLRQYWKGNYVKEISDEMIAVHIEHGPNAPTVNSTMHMYPIDGAPHRVSQDSTSFGHRDANWAMVILAGGEDPASDESNIKWVRDYSDALAPHSQAGGYINFMSDDDGGRSEDNYGANYEKLADVKRKYDPDNLFHVNQNIKI